MKSKTLSFSKLFPRTSETLAEKQPSSPPILINLYQSNLQNNHTSDEDSQHSSFVQASLEPLVKWTDFQEETRMRLVLLVLFNSFAAHLLRILTTHPRLLNLYSSDSRNLLLCKDCLNWSGTELLSRTGSKVAGSAFPDYQDQPSCPKDGLGFLVSNWIPLSAEGWVPWNSLWICVRRFGSLPSSNQREDMQIKPDIRILWLEGLSFMAFLLYIILRTCNKYVQDANMHIRRLDAEMELHSVEIEAGHISYITSHNSLYKTMVSSYITSYELYIHHIFSAELHVWELKPHKTLNSQKWPSGIDFRVKKPTLLKPLETKDTLSTKPLKNRPWKSSFICIHEYWRNAQVWMLSADLWDGNPLNFVFNKAWKRNSQAQKWNEYLKFPLLL